jgi:hypothetical protein
MFRGEEIEPKRIRPLNVEKKAAGEGGAGAPTSPSPGARSVFADISKYCSPGAELRGVSSDSSLKIYPSRVLLVIQISFLGIFLIRISDNGFSISASGHPAPEISYARDTL